MQDITTINPKFSMRTANEDDAALVLQYMKKLGEYQNMADEVTATEAQIKRLLQRKHGEAVFSIYNGEACGFVYFCEKSSAFTGRSGLFIDGFLVDEHVRHEGLGKIMMGYMCRLAKDRECEMLEWGFMDWNAPTIRFYKALGAYKLDDMSIYRFSPEDLATNASLFDAG